MDSSPEARVAARKPAEGSPKQVVRDVTEVRPPRLTQHPQAHPQRGLRGEMVAPGPRARAGGEVTAWAAPRQAPGLDLVRPQRPSRPGAPGCPKLLPHTHLRRARQGPRHPGPAPATSAGPAGPRTAPPAPCFTASLLWCRPDARAPHGDSRCGLVAWKPRPPCRCHPCTCDQVRRAGHRPLVPIPAPPPTPELSAQGPTPAPGPLDGVWE